jgi:glycosyltransferase involved in cell wall biosynthesis
MKNKHFSKKDFQKVFIVIPAYNEEKMIGKVVKDIKKEGFSNIVVVDDGSTDNTSLVAKKSGAKVLRHIINRGKGAAVKTGIEYAKLKNASYVITIDGDGQHNQKDIIKIYDKLKEGYEVVLGSRFLNKKNKMPFFNKIANFFANFLTFIIYELYVSDSQSGFRGYNRKAIDLMDIQSEDYDFESRIIYEIARHKLKFCEVPIDVFYTKYSMSKIRKQNLINGIKTLVKMIIS